MEAVLEKLSDYLVQITTPYSIGTGLYLPRYQLVVTSEFVVRDNREVVISGKNVPEQTAAVVLFDQLYDLAFIRPMTGQGDLPELPPLKEKEAIQEGMTVWSVGKQTDRSQKVFASVGELDEVAHQDGSFRLIQHSASVAEECLGGPLLDPSGELIGLNCFFLPEENSFFALPFFYVEEVVQAFLESAQAEGARCLYCLELVFSTLPSPDICSYCKKEIRFPSRVDPFQPEGVAATIENILAQLGHEPGPARRGPNCWVVREGSAIIQLSYHAESGMISGEATLCLLPENPVDEVYRFLLRQNFELEGLSFYIEGQAIVLSLIIYDRYLNLETGMHLLRHLLKKADYYDNVLVEEYGARWANA